VFAVERYKLASTNPKGDKLQQIMKRTETNSRVAFRKDDTVFIF
jgi:hypothetical protein